MIQGVITGKDVILRAPTIVRQYGLATWFRCCEALLARRRTTFLDLVFATHWPRISSRRIDDQPRAYRRYSWNGTASR